MSTPGSGGNPARADRCRGRARHWRIAFGTVGMRTPVCAFCGSPNPKPLSGTEWADLTAWASQPGVSVGDHVRTAIEQHQARPMALTEKGVLKPVSEFSPIEKWWCSGEECNGERTDPHVHCQMHVHAVDLLTGKTIEPEAHCG